MNAAEVTVTLVDERAALARAHAAAAATLERLGRIEARGSSSDAITDEYVAAVIRGAVRKLQQDLVVFGRIDDDHAWRVGLYGIDEGGDRLVIDWRAPFAARFYQASLADPLGLERRVSYVGSIEDLLIEEFTTGLMSGTSPLLAEPRATADTRCGPPCRRCSPNRTRSCGSIRRRSSCCEAGPVPARRWWVCIAPLGWSTTIRG
jgi:hypothetical protein